MTSTPAADGDEQGPIASARGEDGDQRHCANQRSHRHGRDEPMRMLDPGVQLGRRHQSPKQSGQSGQPSPESVARTSPPTAIRTKVAAAAAMASLANRVKGSSATGKAGTMVWGAGRVARRSGAPPA